MRLGRRWRRGRSCVVLVGAGGREGRGGEVHEELRRVGVWELLCEARAELAVGFDDVGDALARVEARDLADVFTRGIEQRVHLDVCAGVSQAVVVVAQVPVAEGLIQAIEPTQVSIYIYILYGGQHTSLCKPASVRP